MDSIGLLLLSFLCLIFGYIAGNYSRHNRLVAENSGEVLIKQSLAKYCENRDAHVLNNVTLRLEDGSTTQVDHIIVSTKGVFVIETKHYKGWIFANAKSKFWTQTIYKKKYKFQNPTFQNYKHVKVIQNLFDFLDPQAIHNFVVFSGESIFKTVKPNNVFYQEELIPAIELNSDGILSLNRVQFCIGRLEYMRLELTLKTDIEHQMYLTKKFCR